MLTIEKHNGSVKCTLSSDMSLVDLFSRMLKDMLVYAGVPVANEVTVVARELLSNAVMHGNREDPAKQAVLLLEELCGAGFVVTVKDEGRGFDFLHLDPPTVVEEHHARKRGYVVIRNYAQRIIFRDNGSSVSVYISLGEPDWDSPELRDAAEKAESTAIIGAV
jgi:serine/threonine-protein kinase RsbW